jgi:hypothetical protein
MKDSKLSVFIHVLVACSPRYFVEWFPMKLEVDSNELKQELFKSCLGQVKLGSKAVSELAKCHYEPSIRFPLLMV